MKKLVKIALIIGGVTLATKIIAAKKAEWQGLTESEAREKLASKMAGRVPDEKVAEIADKVVSKMRERGVIRDDEEPPAPADPSGVGDEAEYADGDVDLDTESEDETEPA